MHLIRLALLCLLLSGLAAAPAWSRSARRPTPPARPSQRQVVELPVSFQVANTNTSKDPCLSDGNTYTIVGHITAPRAALANASSRAITLYLFGYEGGQWAWDLKVPGYDYAAEMAKRGHVSLTIDELGYGHSGLPPDGNLTCQGALADMAHQIVQDLRAGSYEIDGGAGLRFGHVVIAGHDVGGQVAEMEAYSYHDVDGLILVTWADQGFNSWILQRSVTAANVWCTTDSLRSLSGPSGYVHFVSESEFRGLLFYNTDPRVLDVATAQREPNPCGVMRSVPQGVLLFDSQFDKQITVPVLDVYGANDTVVWGHEGEAQQQDDFGSRDKTTAFIPHAGHFVMLSRTAPLFRSVVARWLASHFSN